MKPQLIAVMAVCTAIVYVFVRIIQVPIPATGGFTHPGAVAEMFVAMAFGPIVGLVSAGLGAALVDATTGWASFAPLTLVAHGALGLLAGWLGWKKGWSGMLIGWIVGGLALVAVYFIGQAWVYGLGVAAALVELQVNLIQVALGILGIGLFQLVKQAYPQIEQLAGDTTFEEV